MRKSQRQGNKDLSTNHVKFQEQCVHASHPDTGADITPVVVPTCINRPSDYDFESGELLDARITDNVTEMVKPDCLGVKGYVNGRQRPTDDIDCIPIHVPIEQVELTIQGPCRVPVAYQAEVGRKLRDP